MEKYQHQNNALELAPPASGFSGGWESRLAPEFGPPTMRRQKQPMIQTPQHISQPGSVPQASQQHGHHQVPIRLPTPMTVPSHRNIEVIPQPGRKADMPMPPEQRWAGYQVRRPEIDH